MGGGYDCRDDRFPGFVFATGATFEELAILLTGGGLPMRKVAIGNRDDIQEKCDKTALSYQTFKQSALRTAKAKTEGADHFYELQEFVHVLLQTTCHDTHKIESVISTKYECPVINFAVNILLLIVRYNKA